MSSITKYEWNMYQKQQHWIDDADRYRCPVCGFETASPAKHEGCRCPKCGFQDEKDKETETMKVIREAEIENPAELKIGDRITVDLPEESSHTATAIQQEVDGMLFIFDQFLDEARPMNKDGRTEGGYDASDIRKFLQELSEQFPEELKERMIPFENGDTVRLLTLPEVCGEGEHWNECEGQIPYFKDRRNRIAERKGDSYEWMWTATVVSGAYFANVDGNGDADYGTASASFGVRPAFKVRVRGNSKNME